MNRFRAYFPRDDAPVTDGDAAWLGVDMRRSPAQLEAGLCCDAVNLRFTDGRPVPRKGLRLLAWGARAESGYGPGDILPYGEVAGAGVFNDPRTGQSWQIIVTAAGVFRTQPGTNGVQMDLPEGTVIPARVQLIQTFNGLVMLRGPGLDPIFCDDLNLGWRVPPEVTEPGKMRIPPSSHGVYWQNRLFLIYEGDDANVRDTIWVSDFGLTTDALQGSASYNGFRINQGSRDRLVALYPFNETSLIAGKTESVYMVSGVYGTNEQIAANARLDKVTSEYGVAASRSFVQVGADVWFLGSRRGLVSIRMTEQNKVQGVDVPISRDIEPLIRQIGWEHAADAATAFWDNRVYLAVPFRSGAQNDSVLVFDTITGRWAGRDESPTLKLREWIKFEYGGQTRLGFVSEDGYMVLYEDGAVDQVGLPLGAVGFAPIQHRLLTRGYLGNQPGRKFFTMIRARLSTWFPKYSVIAHVDGVHESRTVAQDRTESRVRYERPHTQLPWDPSNAADDWATPYRGDYAVMVPPQGMIPGASGIAPDTEQTAERGWNLRERGQYVQLEVIGTQGRTVVESITVETMRGNPAMTKKL